MNLSPVFGLFPDTTNEVQDLLDKAIARSLPLEATDHLGVVSRLWPISDQHIASQVASLMGPKPIFIADGHHRYETALRYFEDQQTAGEATGEDPPQGFILMMLVGMSDPGLLILPTHRLVSGLPGLTSDRVVSLLSPHFSIETIGKGDRAASDAWELIEAEGTQNVLGFGTTADGAWHLARLHDSAPMAKLAAAHSADWKELAVSVLHVLVLDHLVPTQLGAKPTCRYVHLLREVTDAMAAKSCDLAVLVPPATMGHVESIAGNLEKMPPKSTYFYPKLLSGLVFNPLRSH